jgi:hypothetical protein
MSINETTFEDGLNKGLAPDDLKEVKQLVKELPPIVTLPFLPPVYSPCDRLNHPPHPGKRLGIPLSIIHMQTNAQCSAE